MKKFSLLLIITAITLLFSSCADPVEEKLLDLGSQIDDLESRVTELEAQVIIKEVEKETLNSAKNDQISESEDESLAEYPFESCKTIPEYSTDKWFTAFKTNFEKQYPVKEMDPYFPNFTKLTQACYSSQGNVVVFMQPATNMNIGFHLFKYDTKKDTLSETYVNSAGQTSYATPIEFGKRNGNVINMFASGTQNDCKLDETFQYNYIENTISLKEECKKCGSQEKICNSY